MSRAARRGRVARRIGRERLVIGLMDLRAMAVVTAAITAERLARAPVPVARAIGAVAAAAGLLLIARAAGLA